MGSGLGSNTTNKGDYDICLFDDATVAEYGLRDRGWGISFSWRTATTPTDATTSAAPCTIGVVVHSDCRIMGHGPGVTTLLTSKRPLIEGKIDPKANLADILL